LTPPSTTTRAEPDLSAAIRRTCQEGVDVFFDNVGGPTLDAAIANLRLRGRVVDLRPYFPDRERNAVRRAQLGLLIGKRAVIEGLPGQ
jgi:NADPH-dependent curcumin reductase CurA